MSNEEREQIIDNLICEWGRDYLRDRGYYDDEPFPMDEFNEVFHAPEEAVRAAFYGGRYGFEQDCFNPNDEYFKYGVYLESIPYIDDYLLDIISKDDFVEWAKEQNYIDTSELEEDDEE